MSRTARILVLSALGLVVVLSRALVPAPKVAAGSFGHGPTVVLVHGLGSDASDWLPVARRLAHTHRVLLVDLPGHGASPMPATLTLQAATEALDEALASEKGPLTLVGHSLGGLVAASEACDHPERVQSLVLVETALKPPMDAATRAAMLARLDRDFDGLVRDVYLDFGRDRRQGVALWREASRVPQPVMKAWIRLALGTDLSDRAAGIECPVTAVLAPRSWPEQEAWSTTSGILGYDAIPDVHAQRIPDCGHFVMLDQSAALATVIARAAHPRVPPVVAMR